MIQVLASRGADVNAKEKAGVTALMAAASSGRVDALRVLLDKGADVNAVDLQGTSALMAAAFGGHTAAGQLLLSRGANANLRDQSGRTALMATALSGDTALAGALLAAKADLAAEDLAGSTALTYAASSGHAPIVDLFYDRRPHNRSGPRRLVCRARLPHRHRAHPPDARRRPRPQGQRHATAGAGGGVQLRRDSAVPPGRRRGRQRRADEDGMTALMAAAQRGLAPIGELLISRGADPEARNKQDQTAWYYAAMNQHTEFVELLKKDPRQQAAVGGYRFTEI